MITISGLIEKVTYHNPENNYAIARLKNSANGASITVVGYLAGLSAGEKIRAQGAWESHSRYGEQFRIQIMEVILPTKAEEIEAYLSSGIIKGLGQSFARKIVDFFGDESLDILENQPARLTSVPGIGRAKANMIISAWREHHSFHKFSAFLAESGIASQHAARIAAVYGPGAMEFIKEYPYRICEDIPEIGFQVADELALASGFAPDSPERIRASMLHVLRSAADDGHTFLPEDMLIEKCMALLKCTESTVYSALENPPVFVKIDKNPEGGHIYLKDLYDAESETADRLNAILTVPSLKTIIDENEMKELVLSRLAIELSEEQKGILKEVVTHKAAIITGGPGTGKTTLIRSICVLAEKMGRQILLAAPTGRAARRLSDVTGRKASTIHKMLGYTQGEEKFERNSSNPLEADLLIVDEASMIDIVLMHNLLKATPMTATILLVGDTFQLPSVGPGNVLGDLIKSGKIPSFQLTEIFRQAKASPIIMNAHRVNKGFFPDFSKPEEDGNGLSEFYFINQATPQTVVNSIIELCSERIPKKFGFDRMGEIQVLCPMHKGEAGTLNLNLLLQKALNKEAQSADIRGMSFRVGDKVMHLKNNYQKEVFNGDIGMISGINTSTKKLTVNYEGRDVEYDFDEVDELSLAYAISVHKSQGSEYPAVIIPVLFQHYMLLQRNLIYTAMTRGKQLVILIGDRKALIKAIGNDRPAKRLSNLSVRIASAKTL
ncbi:SF1B family DNA helicase RecD2 [Desulforegula conservatrix]|uniref:SF1B family DNA helicase RecD2 n=1 Tax=Desulforegula conservatrix TaxID=153026 RepID=UPI000552BBFB|nr:ATP-dependent RecD-like DNA helicase [Desulforegula conservatrix]